MGIGTWWKRMKDTYGDLPPKQAFMAGKNDGKVLTMEVKANKMATRAERRYKRRQLKNKLSI